jgi:hypothetical protein
MKKTILTFLLRVLILLLIATIAGLLNFIFSRLASLYDTKWQQAQIYFDLFEMERAFSIFIGIPYLLYLIIFGLIRKKRISLITKAFITGILVFLFAFLLINTLTMGRPNILDVYVLIPMTILFISGFSLPFVDEFFMKKFGLKKTQ